MKEIETVIFNNGNYALEPEKRFKVITIRESHDEDWKTAMVHKIKPIPKGTELICSYMRNFYGYYLTASYNDWGYYIDPQNCDYIGRIV